ncbi:hypothetical protein CBS101457_005222 [Exobasidium rhododendri]|nr:hypothetical protein CBS101457_005222 [Exobasidium rhododendri]
MPSSSTLATLPAYKVDVPINLLNHTLNQLNRAESERLIAAEKGTPLPRLTDDPNAYFKYAYSTKISTNRANVKHNRWNNILAYDHSLLPGPYLNASLIPPYPCDDCPPRRSYIAGQAPLPHTFSTFYASMMENKVPLIVNLSAFNEHGHVKADQYWPMKKNESWDATVGYRIEHREDPKTIGDYRSDLCQATQYQLRLYKEEETPQEWDFSLLHVTSWPDFGAFSSAVFAKLLDMIEEVGEEKQGPMWIHCSAGIGRSGTVIASLLARDLGSCLMKAMKLDSVSTPSLLGLGAIKAAERLVDHERRYRPKMVQTADQLGMIANVAGCLLQQKKE